MSLLSTKRSHLLLLFALVSIVFVGITAAPAFAGVPILGTPTISGTPQEGVPLTVNPATNSGGAITIGPTWQWEYCTSTNQNNCFPGGSTSHTISGATSAQYSPTASVLSDRLFAVETAGNSYGYTSAYSTSNEVVANDYPAAVSWPAISGSATVQEGVPLTAQTQPFVDVSGAPISVSYQWDYCTSPYQDNCFPNGTTSHNISGATSPTYVPSISVSGDRLFFIETATNTYGSTSTYTTSNEVVASDVPSFTTWPSLNTSATAGQVVAVTPGTVTDSSGAGISISYQWYSCTGPIQADCWPADSTYVHAITGATSSSYTPTSSIVGDKLFVGEVATNAYGTTGLNVYTTQTVVVASGAPYFSGPTISGSGQVGIPLTASIGTISGNAYAPTYQWYSCTSPIQGGCYPADTTVHAITGATTSTYIPTSNYNGDRLFVDVSVSGPEGSYGTYDTTSLVVSNNSGPTNTASPSITGTAAPGQQLSASHGNWTGSPTSYSYQWQSCDANDNNCTNLSGATGSTYNVTSANGGETLQVQVQASNSSGHEDVDSANTSVVGGNVPVNTAVPTISGTDQQGQTLSVTAGSWTNSPSSYSYQWQDCNGTGGSCSNIAGATSPSYTPVVGDVGDVLGVVVTATNSAGSSVNTVVNSGSAVTPSAPELLNYFSVLGSFEQGQETLTVSKSLWWSPSSSTETYQWEDCTSSGGGCINITGATAPTYVIAPTDVGETLRLVVTATNSVGPVSATTPATPPILENNLANLGMHPDHGPSDVGDPVNVVSGNVYTSVQDMELKGRGPAALWLRTYNSQSNLVDIGPMGADWTTDYETSLTANANGSVSENDPTGAQLVFASSGSGTYTSPVGDTDILTTSANANTNIRSCATAYCLDKSNGVQWQFNSSGQLTGISDINGQTLTLGYTGPRLTSLTNASGRVLAVAYNAAGYISSITNNSDGDEVTYGYTGDELTSVTSANANAGDGGGTTQYVYNSAGGLTDIETPAGTNTNGSNDAGDDQHFTYDATGQALTSTASNGEYAMSFYYNTPAAGETEVKDANGNISTYTYNSNGEITDVTDPYGHQLQYGWNSTGEETSSTDQNGDITTYSYDGYGNLLQQVDPPSSSTAGAPSKTITYTYDTDPSSYDGITDLVTSKTVTQTAAVPGVSPAVNDVTTYCYNGNTGGCPGVKTTGNVGDLESVTSPNANAADSGPTTTYTYDGEGDVLTEITGIGNTDGDGGTTSYCYNVNTSECLTSSTGNLISETTGYGSGNPATTLYSYNADGSVASETDPDLNVTSYNYDADGNTTEITNPPSSGSGSTDETVQMSYDPRDNLLSKLTSQTAPTIGSPEIEDETEYTYNPEDQLLSTTVDRDVMGSSGGTNVPETTTRTYNNEGSLATTVYPVGNTTSYSYNDTQELTSKSVLVTPASGSNPAVYDLTQYTYYPNGQVQTKEDGDLNTTTYYYNPDGTLAEVSQPPDVSADAPEVTTYTYDLAGNRLTTTTPDGNAVGGEGHTTTYTYDNDGNVLTKADSLGSGSTITYTYDNNDQPLTEVDADGQTTDYEYDPQGEVVEKSFPGCTVSTAACTSLQWTYDGDGNVTETQDASGTTAFTYDGDGNLTSETLPSGLGGGVLGYTYNLANQRISETEPGAAAASTYTYDEAGDLMSITDGSGAETAYGYTADGQLASVAYPNDGTYSTGAGAAYVYGPAGQTLSVTNTAAGGSTITSLAYGYDADLNVVSITDQNNETANYTYDALERLTSETAPANFEVEGAPVIDQQFGYDADGNRTSLTVGSDDTTGAVSSTYNYNPEADELETSAPTSGSGSTTTYCYDDDGQLQASTVGSTSGDCTTGTITSFSYDPEGDLVGADGDVYVYDAAGDRVDETESGITTTQVFDPDTDDVIQQTVGANGSSPTTTNYEYGANGIVSADPTTDTNDASITYYGEDALGSVIALTNGSGAATDEYVYDAFGQNLAHNGSSVQPFTFMGNQTDMTTGLDDFNAREYDPALGSFLSEDPVSGNIEDPSTLDAYAYGVDDPYGEPDPSGMDNQADFASFVQNSPLLGPVVYYLQNGDSERDLDSGEAEDEGDLPAGADYDYACSGGAFVLAIEICRYQTRDGHVYWSNNIGVGVGKYGANGGLGWLENPHPTNAQIDKCVRGWSITSSVSFGLSGGDNYCQPGSAPVGLNVARQAGLGTPGAEITAGDAVSPVKEEQIFSSGFSAGDYLP